MSARPHSTWRFAAGSALFALALLSSLVHMGLVRHEVCSDHGELVETDDQPGLLAQLVALDQRPVAHHADIAHAGLHSVRTAGAETDEHCPLTVAPSRREISAPLLGAPVLVAGVVDVAAAAPPLSESRTVGVLDVAPKHGPPAASV